MYAVWRTCELLLRLDAAVYSGSGSGLTLEIKKCMAGYGTRFIVISFKSVLSAPSKRIEAVRFVRTCAAQVFIWSKGEVVVASGRGAADFEDAAAGFFASFCTHKK